ncbi:LOW QUALITY PROTEIN: otogelin [Fundulus heteroclitus]|uniref:LOW QUALITY PROTEIN: otogelin n=1 Tax=Fundulus heteroclitus TaxID=8078 RepID=UPI00165AC673|nr:LOW QUALITY PROTEIN: otogelin [Fundulus heteroclitus]
MDPDLFPRCWRRPLHSLITVYVILIYQAHLSRGVERVNVSNWDALNNGSTRIKHQKWDTASQGGQDLHNATSALETNTSASRRSLLNGTVASNLTSARIERTQNDLWSQSVNQSSVPLVESSQSSSRTTTGSQDVESNTQNSTQPFLQSVTETRQSNQSPTSTGPTTQSIPASKLTVNSTSPDQLSTKTAQLNQSQTDSSAIQPPTPSQSTRSSTSPKQSVPETSNQFQTKSGLSAAGITQYSQSEASPVPPIQQRTATTSTSQTTDPVQSQTNPPPSTHLLTTSQSQDIVDQASQAGSTSENINHSPGSTVSAGLSSTTSASSHSEVIPVVLLEQPSTTAPTSQPSETTQSDKTQTSIQSQTTSPSTVSKVLTSQSSGITTDTKKSASSTAFSGEASTETLKTSQLRVNPVPLTQQVTTTTSTSQSTDSSLQTMTTTELSSQLSTTKEISKQITTTVASKSQTSDQLPTWTNKVNQTPTNRTPPSWAQNKGGPHSQPPATKTTANQSPFSTAQNSESATSRQPEQQTSNQSVNKGLATVTTATGQAPSSAALESQVLDRLTQTSQSLTTAPSPTTSVMSKASSSPRPTKTTNPKQSQHSVTAPVQPVQTTKHSSQEIESTSAKKPPDSSLQEKQMPPKAPSRKSSSKKTGSYNPSISTAESRPSLKGTGPVSQSPVSKSPPRILYSVGSTTKSTQLSSSQAPLSPSATRSNLTSQSFLTTTVYNQSPAISAPPDQSATNSVTLAQTSHSRISNNHTLLDLINTDQALNGSLSLKQLTSTPGNSVSGALPPDDRPVNVSQLTRQAKEALKSSKRRFPGEPCEYPCLNGGQCILSESCDCSLFQATGHRCQTVPNLGFEREMTCRTWGQYNFETFDGLYFYFPGRCTYTLLRDCEETTQASIVVQVHNDPNCSSAPYSCQRSVSVFLPWEGEIRLHATSITFKGQSLQLPHHIHDLQLQQISQYVLVTQQQGFTLAWEGRSGSVYIKLSPEFVGRTCGLCGNFNADVQDDLKTSYGVLTQDVEMFGNSWMEMEPHQDRCLLVPSAFSSPCARVEAQILLKVEEICAMLLDPPFQRCHDFVSPLPYMASCSNDLCMSGPSGDVVCQVFSEYARACAHADHPLHNWRQHIPQCVKRCPLGLQYRECISCCPESCNLEQTCIDSKLACLDGCYCPEGLIYEDGSCVAPADCPCEYHGMFYPSGQTLQEECNNCTCVGGAWNCTDNSCPGECSVTGDMYFQSFDGRIFTFPATCQYVLAKSRSSGKFTVTIQNAPCGANLDGACIQSVNLVIDEDPRTEITLSHVGEVFMAGQYRISLPYSDDIFHIQELSSMFLQVRTALGLHLQYSWTEFRLYLQADETWKDDTVGLCGTFNGNIQDDFLSPSGMIESTPHLFGNAWKVSSACSLSLSTPQLDPCDTHQQAVTYASEMCDILNQDLFSACHEYLSPTPFHQQCHADTCRCGTPCLCSSLAHYARHCRRFSIIVDFRSHVSECAVTCPATMQYGTCVSSCQRRCASLSVPQHCGEDCEEGCVCPLGSFYNHRTHTCVHRSECPCSFLGADYEPGDVILTSAGVQLCLNGKLVSQTTETDRLCPPGQVYLNCSDGEDSLMPGRGVACERTCESFLLNITCSAHEPCASGCACPPGLLKHGDECFEPDACPCLWKGKEYFPGDRVSTSCYQCVCQHGTFQCVFRPCPSMCTTYGDRHYRTFDGLLFDYAGTCKVYLVKSSADVMLNVLAENVDCFDSGIICRKSLLINIGGSFISFDDDSGTPNPSSVMDIKQQVFIWPAGYFTIIHFPEEDVTILWDRKTTVHIQVGPRWQGKLSGLCGNFDLKTVNEMRTPDNIDSPTAQEFGNSWTATECVNSPDIRHPCSLSPLREPFAKRQCAVLLSEVFQTCHPVVDVTWFYMNCLADTCACSRGGDCECFCTSVAAYAQRCCHEGIPVDWRSPSLCPYDCEFYNKVLGKGPFRLFTFRDQTTLVSASGSSGFVFLQRVNSSADAAPGIFSEFMMTPGLSRARPHDASRVSFEAAGRPNYFLHASPSGQVRLAKWEDSDAFWDEATFILHRNTWVSGYDSLESHAKPGFFLHATLPRLHLLKFRHTYSFRKASLFRLTGSRPDTPPSPRCMWRYDSCISPCFKTCSDPSAESCVTIPQVEGCLPVCPPNMVLDEVTRRCVHAEDCIRVPDSVPPPSPSTAAETSETTTSSTPPHTHHTVKAPTSKYPIPSQAPPGPEELTRPETLTPSAAPEDVRTPSGPTVPSADRPEVVEPPSTTRVTETPPTTLTAATRWTTKPMSTTGASSSPTTSRTTRAPFDTSSTKPPDSQASALTTTAATTTAAQTATSAERPTTIGTSTVTHPHKDAAEATSSAITRTTTTLSPVSPSLSETSVDTGRTTVPSTTTALLAGTSTKAAPVEEMETAPFIQPELPSTSSTTASPVPTSPPVATGTLSSTATSTKTTQPIGPVTPSTTSQATQTETTERTLHIIQTDHTTSSTVSLLSTTTLHRVSPSTASPSASTSASTGWQTSTTMKVTIPESPAPRTPAVSTTASPPPAKMTDSGTHSGHTSIAYSERTSWSTGVPVTGKTTTSKLTSRPLVVPETYTMSTNVLLTTTPSSLPQSPTTETTTHPPYPERTSEPWHPLHWETTSTSTATYRPPMETTSGVASESAAMSTKTLEAPDLPVTSRTTSTSGATTTTTTGTTTPESGATTSRKLITPPAPRLPGSAETLLTTSPVGALPSSVHTTVKPVVIVPITETSQPAVSRVSTTTTTTSSPSLSSLQTTTSATAPAVSTSLDKVTTRLVSSSRATPTIVRTSTFHSNTQSSWDYRNYSQDHVDLNQASHKGPHRNEAHQVNHCQLNGCLCCYHVYDCCIIRKQDCHVSASAASPRLTTLTAPVVVPSPETAASTTTKPAEIPPSPSQRPDSFVSTQDSGIPVPTTTPQGPTTTFSKNYTTQGSTSRWSSPRPAGETPSPSVERSTSMTETPIRTCTPPYAEIVDECTKYICVNKQLILFNKSQSCPFTTEPPNCGLLGFAVLVNGDKCCPKWDCPCRCSMFPDLNVITFDGDSFAVFKAASYIVTQLPNETLSVLIQECPADSELPHIWNFTNLCLVSLNITHKSNHVVINRLQRRLYVNSRYAKPRFKKYGFEIYDTGNMYLIRSPAGLKVQWYHSTGMMVIDTDGSGSKLPTMGLCGFCDGDLTNDLTLPNGTVLAIGTDPAVFIDSWQVPNTTSYVSYSRRRDHNCSTSDCSRCLAMLEDNTFAPCHTFVPPSTFCEVWVKDSEYVNNQCVALAAYVATCHKFNICIEWRRPDYCPFVCPSTLSYQACLPACTSQSCPNHDFDSDPDHCSGLTEGCVCPRGTLLHRPYSALCIPPEKCACTDSSGVPRAHGDVWKASKDGCCMYRCDNDTIVPVEYNCSSTPAPVCHRTGEMIISMSDDASCCPHKVCVCNQTLCDHVPPECKYGEKLVSYYRPDSCCPDYVCECDPDLCESDIPACREDQTLIATRADGSCCLAHICMCSSCVEPPPSCQDGEVLSVDSNSTDRCCPSYQCVCEPYRCPQLSCPVGMSVVSVSSPNLCCPNQTCDKHGNSSCFLFTECTCHKVASPKCSLGEAAQLDRAFLSDPQNQCACKRYTCVREAVCVFGERGLLQPGQTLVEHGVDGLCYSRHCSQVLDPASGFHLLRTSTVNCSAHCQPNQIYVPPKDQSTCCGVCKNISCLYQHENGTIGIYKPGRSWVSNCKKFDCSDTSFGPTLISYSYSCPPFNETECTKIGGTVVNYMDGCCKMCKEDGKSCQKVTVRMTIRKNDCRSNRPVNIVSCDGKCPSASIYNYNINTYARFCKCCRETGLQRRSVQLYCSSNATWVSYTIQEPTDCACQWS